jgi:hypothetical protein
VGDLRVINAGMLDAYLLKSIDGFGLGALHGMKMVKCGANMTKKCFFLKGDDAEWKDEATGKTRTVKTVQLGGFSMKNDPWAAAYVKKMGHARVNIAKDQAKQALGTTTSDINFQLSGASIHTGEPGLLSGELAVDTEILHGARFSAEICTRGCHWIPRLLASSEQTCDQWHSSRKSTFLTSSHCESRPNTEKARGGGSGGITRIGRFVAAVWC